MEAHDLLLCIQTGQKVKDENRMRYVGGQFFIKSEEQMEKLFPYALDAVHRTAEIADRCNVTITFGESKLPHYEVPEGYTPWTYLNHLCEEGFPKRFPEDYPYRSQEELRERLRYELDVIRTMGFVDYFLIVWDFINYARVHGIMVGPGRGSAAGSIVSYCLTITNIDPIRYDLLFERFLNPERVSMPDIDIDFEPERRQEVIDYVERKYGKANVTQIVTFGTLKAKAVIRDVARVLDLPYSVGDSLSKMVPNPKQGEVMTIEKAMEMNPELAEKYRTDEQVRYLLDMSKRLEGLPRHTSTHAAGVVICPDEADRFVPLSLGTDNAVNAQFTMVTLERLGLLKMDFLGLRNLTVLKDTVSNIKKTEGIDVDIDHLEMDDKAVLEDIGQGKTMGVFQLESAGMTSFMKELKPQGFEDIVAGISLYRP